MYTTCTRVCHTIAIRTRVGIAIWPYIYQILHRSEVACYIINTYSSVHVYSVHVYVHACTTRVRTCMCIRVRVYSMPYCNSTGSMLLSNINIYQVPTVPSSGYQSTRVLNSLKICSQTFWNPPFHTVHVYDSSTRVYRYPLPTLPTGSYTRVPDRTYTRVGIAILQYQQWT